jgi:DNA polymerase III delta prime subunit
VDLSLLHTHTQISFRFSLILDGYLFECDTKVRYDTEGLETLVEIAEGDMRHALNLLQSTHSGSGFVSSENVYKVGDQPHPRSIKAAIEWCREGDLAKGCEVIEALLAKGYDPSDVIQTFFRVVRNAPTTSISDADRLAYMKVSVLHQHSQFSTKS